ncbi:MAG: polyhydroxybutyrate depolymerase [Paraglaciecola sp.]|nr:polyhydroxybutyrate depolymerase [Paraglaciecola sp.]NCT49462.1 polyhydroxybutyrate depolymerase [Paraglaciecola sp.]
MLKKLTFLALFGLSGHASAGQLNLQLEHISLSGLSSGGYMANQFHLAHSDWVDKVGIIAAGPYYCAQGSIKTALEQCVNKVLNPIDLPLLQQKAIEYEASGKIAPLLNLKHSKVWLLHGTLDSKVHSQVSDMLYQQYQSFVETGQLQYINDQAFAHHFPTQDYGSPCDQSNTPFLGNCQYDAAGAMLGYLFPDLAGKVATPGGQIVELDQQVLGGETASSLGDKAYAYVPATCAKGESCQLHISFHGCQQNDQSVGRDYVEHNGLNNWADSNHMVVLYPQTKNSTFLPLNPQGCWDWWGYTDADYATRDGLQIKAVSQMARNLAHYPLN